MRDRKGYSQECTWKEATPGGIILDAGNAVEFKTGDWRSMKPIWDKEKCKHCLLCWVLCPDMAIIIEDGKVQSFDYDHCKGCGLCVNQCKFKALELIPEE